MSCECYLCNAGNRPKARDAVTKMGYEIGEKLGSGAFAQVFAMKGDPTKVVKITGDESDAYVAELARRAQLEGKCSNLVRIYRVVECTEEGRDVWGGNKSFVIISERLQPIPYDALEYLPGSGRAINQDCYDLFRAVRLAEEEGVVNPDFFAGRKDTNVWSVAALNAKGMVDDLHSLGVTSWDDFKLTNVMLRPGDRIVVSDFGCTESPRPDLEVAA